MVATPSVYSLAKLLGLYVTLREYSIYLLWGVAGNGGTAGFSIGRTDEKRELRPRYYGH